MNAEVARRYELEPEAVPAVVAVADYPATDVSVRSWWRRYDGWIAALGALVLLAVWWEVQIDVQPTVTRMSSFFFDQYDFYLAKDVFSSTELGHGHLPLWNPYQACGVPHLAIQQVNAFYPPNFLYLALPAALANKLIVFFHYWLAFVAILFYARTISLTWPAAFVGAFAFTFCGVMQWFLFENPFLFSAAYIPLALACTERLLADGGRKWVWRLTAVMSLFFLACHPYFFQMGAYMIAATVVLYAVRWLRAGDLRRLVERGLQLAAAGVLTALLSAWILMPFIEALQVSHRQVGALTIDEADYLAGLFKLDVVAMSLTGSSANKFSIFVIGYVGIATLLLLCFTPLNRALRARTQLFSATTMFFGLLALGQETPLYAFFFHHIPTFNWSRAPFYNITLADFGLAMLAAIGADVLVRREPLGRGGWLWAAAVSVVGLVYALGIDLREVFGGQALFAYGLYQTIHVSQVLLLASVLILWLCLATRGTRFQRVAVLLFPLLVAVDVLGSFSNRFPLPSTAPDFWRAPPKLVRFLTEHQGYDRTYVHREYDLYGYTPEGPTILPIKMGQVERIYDVVEYDNMLPRAYTDFYAYMERGESRRGGVEGRDRPSLPAGMTVHVTTPMGKFRLDPSLPSIRLLDLMSVRFIVVGREDQFLTAGVPPERYPLLYVDDDFTVLENPRAVPRAYVVSRYEVQTDPQAIPSRLAAPDFDPLSTVIIDRPVPGLAADAAPAGSASASSPAERWAAIRSYEHETVTVAATSTRPGLLVLTDQFYPGWTAEVDGVPTPIYRANDIFRAVPILPGTHTVTFRYRPHTFVYGTLLTASTVLGAGVWFGLQRRRVKP